MTINSNGDCIGLFGYVGTGGTVQNVKLTNVNITGNNLIGGVVGWNYGGTVSGCEVNGKVTATYDWAHVGGLVGQNYGTISNNTFSGEVNGTDNKSSVGGLVGQNYGTVSNNTVSGSVSGDTVGGLVGYNNNTVSGNNVSGSVSGNIVGGLVGSNNGTVSSNTVNDNTTVSGTSDGAQVGAVVGYNYSGATVSDNTYDGNLDLIGDGYIPTGHFVTTENGMQYVDNDSGNVLFELSGAKDLTDRNIDFDSNEVTLSVNSFKDNTITVESNDGGYTFALVKYYDEDGDLSGKTFVAKGNNVIVDGDGVTVDVSNGNNVIELGEIDSFNVTGFGAGDVIKLYDEMVQYGVSILGIESDGNDGARISIGNDDKNLTITVGGLNVGGADWTFDEDNQTAKIVAEAGAALVDGQIVYASAGGTQFEVSGVTTSNNFEIYADGDYKFAALNAAAFTSDVKVESNDGGYDIILRGRLNGIDSATFTATEGNDNISNEEVSGVLIDGGAGDDYIYNGGGVTASVKGGAGADLFAYGGGEMTITDYVDGTDKIVTNSSITISDEVEVSGFDVVLTTSYPGNLPGNTSSGKIVVKGAANLSELTLYDYDDNPKTYTIPVMNTFNAAGTAVTVNNKSGDFSANSALYSITASQQNSTLVANAKANQIIVAGGGENILTGGAGNDTFKFSADSGGIVTDYGIGATKDGSGKALTTASGSDIVKVDGSIKGIYFDRDASSKQSATFTATIVYGDDQVVVLKDIIKKPTKTGSAPIYQTNDVAAATLKIWDTSSGKQALLSATKLKKFFHDDSDDSFTEILKPKTDYLVDISEGNKPENNPFDVAPSSDSGEGNYSDEGED